MKPAHLIISASAIITLQLHAQDPCLDPANPDCWCTNCPPYTNGWTPIVYPPGSLQMRIDLSNFYVTNTVADHVYQISQSTNLLDWSFLGSRWTNSVGLEKSFPYTPTNEQRFYRVRDVYFQTVFGTVNRVTNTYPCVGTYEGYATYYYYEEGEHWGNIVNTNTYWQFAGNGHSNEVVAVVGRYGDGGQYCGSNSVTFRAVDPYYRFSLYFKSNAPSAGTSWPLIIGGFVEQD